MAQRQQMGRPTLRPDPSTMPLFGGGGLFGLLFLIGSKLGFILFFGQLVPPNAVACRRTATAACARFTHNNGSLKKPEKWLGHRNMVAEGRHTSAERVKS